MKPSGKCYRKTHTLISRPVGTEIVIVPTGGVDREVGKVYTISGCGVRMWELIDGKNSLVQIRDIMLREYDVPPAKLEKDLGSVIDTLLRKGLIEAVLPARKGGG